MMIIRGERADLILMPARPEPENFQLKNARPSDAQKKFYARPIFLKENLPAQSLPEFKKKKNCPPEARLNLKKNSDLKWLNKNLVLL